MDQRTPSVVIIGAGMTGILMMIKLREAGIRDITIFEKADRIGGTWRENTYPGIACDVPAHGYTYSFEPNPSWSHRFANGHEIYQYFQKVSDKYGVTNCVNFSEEITRCVYNDSQWQITTSKGRSLKADFVVCATGILHHLKYPEIPGLQSFKGKQFHTARWDHSVNLANKRVGIIGTGSTAAQIIPELVKEVKALSVFQRTPQWIFPVKNRRYSDWEIKRANRNPNIARRAYNRTLAMLSFLFARAVIGKKLQHAFMSWACETNLKREVKDPALREKLTPNYKVGCKRLVVSSTFYQGIQAKNCELVTDAIDSITEDGVKTKDGKNHKLDVLVLATGFKPFEFMRPMELKGRNGIDVNDAWADKIQAYRSVTLPSFPNFFLMGGPNSPIGNQSVIKIMEVQTNYVLKLIDAWRTRKLERVEPCVNATAAFNKKLKTGFANTVWLGGCQSWYLDGEGDPALWPFTFERWIKEMETPNLQDFIQTKETASVSHTEDTEAALA